MDMAYWAREVRHTGLALLLALLVAGVTALQDADTFEPVLTVGFAVTLARTGLTVLITGVARLVADSRNR